MAKKRLRPSGDPVVDSDTEIGRIDELGESLHAPVVVSEPSEPMLRLDERLIELLDDSGAVLERRGINRRNFDRQILIDGQWWRHVSDAPDGTWQFMV